MNHNPEEARVEHKLSVPACDPPSADKTKSKASTGQRAQWLRAAILGANDGLLSTTSLMLGVGATDENRRSMFVSGVAGAVGGACSMAVGEFVSVSTQRDIEKMESRKRCNVKPPELTIPAASSPAMTPSRKMASPMRSPMMKVIAADASARQAAGESSESQDDDENLPNPLKAAGASALAFLCGSIVPLASTMFVRESETRIVVLAIVSSIALAVFGAVGAWLGGSPVRISAIRVLVGGWVAMAVTYGLLKPFEKEHGKDKD